MVTIDQVTQFDQVTYQGPEGTYEADACTPLRDAAAAGKVDLWAFGRGTYPGIPLEDGVLPGLRSVGAWRASTDQDWGLDWHRNEGVEITCLTGGKAPFSCEDRDFTLTTGSLTVTRPWQPHRVGRPTIPAGDLCWFIVDVGVRYPNQDWTWPSWLPLQDDDLRRITELLRHNEDPVWQTNKKVAAAVEQLERTLRGEVSRPLSRIALRVAEILLELADLIENERPVLNPYLTSTERMVERFLSSLPHRIDEPWTVESMAEACGIGKTRFIHYCKRVVNVSPLEHLTALRIARAEELLTSTGDSVSEIAFRCGFRSSQYFATVFRRRVGCAPTEVRGGRRIDG